MVRPHPPGPPGVAGIGNVPAYELDRLGFLLTCAREYWDIVRFNDKTSIVNDPVLIGQLLNQTDRGIRRLTISARGSRRRNTSEWAEARSAALPAFRRSRIEARCSELAIAIRSEVASWPLGSRIELLPLLQDMTASIAARFLLRTRRRTHIPALVSRLLGCALSYS